MSSEAQATNIEAMQKELEAAGYQVYPLGLNMVRGVTPNGWVYDNSDGRLVVEAIYNHYQREKRYAEMEAYLTEVYELIVSRAGAEQRGGAKISFAACLPTALIIKLEKLLGK